MEVDSRTKICIKCNVEKSIVEYSKRTNSKYGVQSMCKECYNLLYKTRKQHTSEISPNYLKQCRVCGIEKSGGAFHRNGLAPDGLDSRCKVCASSIGKLKNKVADERVNTKLKLCPGCNIEKPQFEFHKNRRAGDGLFSRCKDCVNEYKASLNYLPDYSKKDSPKLCLTCKVMKTQADFHKNNRLKDGLQTRCKECCRKFDSSRDYVFDESNGNYKKICTKCGKTKQASEFYKSKIQKSGLTPWCKDCAGSYSKTWSKINSGKKVGRCAAYRARKIMATPKWASTESIDELYLEADELTKTTGIRHSVDHIVPLKNRIVCGLHCEANLRVITLSENCSKGNYHWPDMP